MRTDHFHGRFKQTNFELHRLYSSTGCKTSHCSDRIGTLEERIVRCSQSTPTNSSLCSAKVFKLCSASSKPISSNRWRFDVIVNEFIANYVEGRQKTQANFDFIGSRYNRQIPFALGV